MAKVSGSVGGTSIEGYVRSMSRRGHLCSPGQTVTLNLDPAFPHSPDTGDEIFLYENDTLTLTGYVQKVSRSKPSFDWIVEGMDTYQRCQSFFIEDTTIVGHDPDTEQPIVGYVPETTDYWIAYLMGLCGATASIEAGGYSVPQGVQIGLRTVHESLQDIMAYSSQYAWAAPNGTIEVKRTTRSAQNYNLTDFIHFEYKEDDEWTRNVIKVYGLNSGYGSHQTRVFATASASLPNIIPDRIAAIATPMIQQQAEAQRVADYMLSELGDVTWVATGTIVGNPDIHIGQSARMAYLDYDRTDVITSLEVDWNENGYIMQVTTGERCPRISGWAKLAPKVYAGTTKDGVYKSIDNGKTWAEFNAGLPAGNKYVTRLAFNSFEEGMAIVNNRIWVVDDFNSSGSWTEVSTPTTLSSGSSAFLWYYAAVDAPGATNTFDILKVGVVSSGSTTPGNSPIESSEGEYRTWVLHYDGSSGSAVDWTITPIQDTKIIPPWNNIEGTDLASPYVIARVRKKTMVGAGWYLSKHDANQVYDSRPYPNYTRVCRSAGTEEGVIDWNLDHVTFQPDSISTPNVGYVTLVIRVYVKYGKPANNLILYGAGRGAGSPTPGSMGTECGFSTIPGEETYRKWQLHQPGIFVRYTPGDSTVAEYFTTITFRWGGAESFTYGVNGGYDFNFFHSIAGVLPPGWPSYTLGDWCGEWHKIGSSPYGDTHGQLYATLPYPIISSLTAGTLGFYTHGA